MITDYEIPVPRWDISDPFGRAAIKRARWEYKRKAAECESLHYEIERLYEDRESAVSKLVATVMEMQDKLATSEKLLRRSDDARVGIATKNAELSTRVRELEDERDKFKSAYELLKGDFDELEKEHERVIRALTDKGEII